MTHKFSILSILVIVILIASCQTSKQTYTYSNDNWFNMAIAEDVEIYVDTTSIRRDGSVVYACEKRIFLTPESKATYTDKIKKVYEKMGKVEKADKWNDFSYCIYYSLYDCTNKRFRTIWIEDYDSTGKRIVKTVTPKSKIDEWMNVNTETVGDYTFFYICDYDNQ